MNLESYSKIVHLDEPLNEAEPLADSISTESYAEKLCSLIISHDGLSVRRQSKETFRMLLYRLLISRSPSPFPDGFLTELDALFAREKRDKQITKASNLSTFAEQFPSSSFPHKNICSLWKGNITLLDIDAIANAANSAMLGCFTPYHACIDNAIHAVAGPRLREDCSTIMRMQKSPESTGDAKITRGYNLPAKFVLHTVGPIYAPGDDNLMNQQLASCYTACLNTAAQIDRLKSVAFCGISTGVFGFPARQAAQIALTEVDAWLTQNPVRFERIVFNVFSDKDYDIYFQAIEQYHKK